MKKSTIFLFLLFAIFQVNAQSSIFQNIEQGVLLSTRIDADDDFDFGIKGYGVEGGYYFLKKWGKRNSISIDFRLAYGQSERNYINLLKDLSFNPFRDTVTTTITGTFFYKNLSLAIPIKYRYHFSERFPVYGLVGFSTYLSIYNNSKWRFKETEFDWINQVTVSETAYQEENLQQKFYANDFFMLGFGYKKNKCMIDIYAGFGWVKIDHYFVDFLSKFSIVLNAYYKLN